VILGDPAAQRATTGIGDRVMLDDLLRRTAERRPDHIALIDPPDRQSFTDGVPRRLSYAQADRMVSAIAGRLRHLGLSTDAIIGIQMANTVDGVLALLGVLRAGLIAMPLPLLWRRADAVAALRRVGANALIVGGRLGATDHFDLAMNIAAEIFPIRYVCGFGHNPPDGIISFDDLYENGTLDPLPWREAERAAEPGAGAHVAVITWDRTADGLVPVARSHAELMAGGLAMSLESPPDPDAVILSTWTLSSFAGLAVVMVPWLLTGGTLALHQPFDPAIFLAQRTAIGCGTVIVPGPLVAGLADSGHLAAGDGLANVIGVWRAPELVMRSPAWRDAGIRLIDVHVFGEVGLVAAVRQADGRPAAVRFGPVYAPCAPEGTVAVLDIAATPAGTVALRGLMVPRAAFPPGVEHSSLPHLKIAPGGLVDTGYACEPGNAAMAVTAPPPGMVSVGGYRFDMRELQDLIAHAGNGVGTLAALPDALAGHRLSGIASDRNAVHAALTKIGVNPLVAAAFNERPLQPAA
jgi:AMP-binding enzyme